ALLGFLERLDDTFGHVMLWLDHHRAQRRVMGVRGTAVIHGHGEEAGRPKRLAIGGDLLQVPAERSLALVETTDQLTARPPRSGLPGPFPLLEMALMADKRVERLQPVLTFERQMVNPPPLESRERFDLCDHALPFPCAQAIHGFGGPSLELGELEHQEGASLV